MSVDIDKILGNGDNDQQGYQSSQLLPYADSQPNRISIINQFLQRFPALAGPEGVNPEFQEFFDIVVQAVGTKSWQPLYEISDKVLSEESWIAAIQSQWTKHWVDFYTSDPNARGLDVELNMDRFQEIHRNLIGGFNIMTYHLRVKHDEFAQPGSNVQVTEFVKAATELLFTYKPQDGFRVISKIQPFNIDTI